MSEILLVKWSWQNHLKQHHIISLFFLYFVDGFDSYEIVIHRFKGKVNSVYHRVEKLVDLFSSKIFPFTSKKSPFPHCPAFLGLINYQYIFWLSEITCYRDFTKWKKGIFISFNSDLFWIVAMLCVALSKAHLFIFQYLGFIILL